MCKHDGVRTNEDVFFLFFFFFFFFFLGGGGAQLIPCPQDVPTVISRRTTTKLYFNAHANAT